MKAKLLHFFKTHKLLVFIFRLFGLIAVTVAAATLLPIPLTLTEILVFRLPLAIALYAWFISTLPLIEQDYEN